jgi:hypothetical protein
MQRKSTTLIPVLFLAACATLEGPDSSNLSAYCTAENAYRLGSQSRAYFGVCPKATENAFLSGLQRGRAVRPSPPQAWPYFERMELLEKQLLAAGSDAERNQLRERLREAEWWAVHIVSTPGTYSVGP